MRALRKSRLMSISQETKYAATSPLSTVILLSLSATFHNFVQWVESERSELIRSIRKRFLTLYHRKREQSSSGHFNS